MSPTYRNRITKVLNEAKIPRSTEVVVPKIVTSRSFKIASTISEEDSTENKRKEDSIIFY